MLILILAGSCFLFSQQTSNIKFALVIGNGAYTDLPRLANPVNDANDITATLESLGFTVEKILDGSLEQMENGIVRLRNRLSISRDAYGFFFYAGHGVQSNGDNYLIPVNANIISENFLRTRAVAVQTMLDELNDAGNSLNVVVLDACRDNPFGWSRSGARGLAFINFQPADSIIVYATGAGVSGVSNGQQRPAVYNQFFGTAYLGTGPVTRPRIIEQPAATITPVQPAPQPLPEEGIRSAIEPKPPREPRPPRDKNSFSLDGARVFSISVYPKINFSGFDEQGGFGGELVFTFYESYKKYGQRFFLPNSFFFSAETEFFKTGDFDFVEGKGAAYRGNIGFFGVNFGLGALYKIRLGMDQKFILGLGPSFQLYVVGKNGSFAHGYVNQTEAYETVDNTGVTVRPGIGVNASLNFRLNYLISLDFGFNAKTMIGDSPRRLIVYNEKSKENNYSQPLCGIPLSLNAVLGITFWWPR